MPAVFAVIICKTATDGLAVFLWCCAHDSYLESLWFLFLYSGVDFVLKKCCRFSSQVGAIGVIRVLVGGGLRYNAAVLWLARRFYDRT